MIHKRKLHSVRLLLPLLIVDVLFFSAVNPATSSSFVVVAGCVLLGATLYVFFRGLAKSLSLMVVLSPTAQNRIALLAAGLLLFMLLMQSIGQLSIRDAIAALALAAVLYFYFSYLSDAGDSVRRKETRADRN
jgi:hypothetical protein